MLPYTPEIYLRLFVAYNQAIWPLQLIFTAGFVTAFLLSIKKPAIGSRILSALLSAAYIVAGSGFYFNFLFDLFWPAPLLFALCLLQALLLLWKCVILDQLKVDFSKTTASIAGISLMVLAIVYYPLISLLSSQNPTQIQFAGLAPLPTLILTGGLYLPSIRNLPIALTVIPIVLLVFETIHTYLLNDISGMALTAFGLLGFFYLNLGLYSEK